MRDRTGVSPLVDGLLDADLSLYTDGGWVRGGGDRVECWDPTTEALLGRPSSATAAQLDRAVMAARAVFDARGWRDTDSEERAQCLERLADLIDQHHDELVALVVAEVGTPVGLARTLQVGQPAKNFRWAAGAARRGPLGGYLQELEPSRGPAPARSLLVREPIGVVAAITPYNYPINLISWKVGPALAAGCSVVLLPSPQGALCAMAFTRLAERAGIPRGVLQLVIGGIEVSQALARHPAVDLVSFTGSAAAGAEIMALAARTTKRVVLELGGKSPSLLLPSADLSVATGQTILRFARNAGQGCGATTRILVPADAYDEFAARASEFAKSEVPVGDPRDDQTVVGPLISGQHLRRVEGYLQRAAAAGAEILAGGDRPVTDHGFFLSPTLVGNVTNRAEISREELFAPVAVVLPYRTVAEAVAIASDSPYALNAAVWGNHDEAMRVALQLDSGTVAINGGGDARSDVPWGGGKRSGRGAEMGDDGYREFFTVKHVQWPA
jgi:aldehyde dehydrogenase (NAD+)/betaine-aldehyde dehydrogenase